VLHGLYWLTVNLCAERSVLLIVDDLHSGDRASLRFLAYLARRPEDLPLLLITSLRSPEPSADQAMLGELRSDPDVDSVNVDLAGILCDNAGI
jgi:hypothetical protein